MLSLSQERLLGIIEEIHASALLADGWIAIADCFNGLFHNQYAALLERDSQQRTKIYSFSGELIGHSNTDYTSRYSQKSVTGKVCFNLPAGEIFIDLMLPNHSEYIKSEAYQDFFRPTQAEHLLQVNLARGTDRILSFIMRRGGGPAAAYTLEEGRLLKILFPHLRQAAQVWQRLAAAKALEDGFQHAMDAFPFGVLLFDAEGRLISMNRVAESIMQHNDGLSLDRDGKLRGRTPAVTHALHRLLARITHMFDEVGLSADHTLMVKRPSEKRPFSLLAFPLGEKQSSPWFRQPRIGLLLLDPDRSGELSESVMVNLFGLTPAEGRLMSTLVSGVSLRECAERFKVSEHTVRTQLKTLFQKTDTNRQSDLVRLGLTSGGLFLGG
ncbi:MAG: helix-turn-helix transcriptional regulator [Magnetococcales bacterium]|nr:helix-turn-helix transcriptional regulator [Magnetococcales bacterium]